MLYPCTKCTKRSIHWYTDTVCYLFFSLCAILQSLNGSRSLHHVTCSFHQHDDSILQDQEATCVELPLDQTQNRKSLKSTNRQPRQCGDPRLEHNSTQPSKSPQSMRSTENYFWTGKKEKRKEKNSKGQFFILAQGEVFLTSMMPSCWRWGGSRESCN